LCPACPAARNPSQMGHCASVWYTCTCLYS
jgi:hypothetical protein